MPVVTPQGSRGSLARRAARLQASGWRPQGGGFPCWQSAPGSGRSGGCSDGAGSKSPPPVRGSQPEATRLK